MTFKPSVILSLAAGVACALFRSVIWNSAYDAETRLITQPRLLMMFNLFLCLCAVVVVLVFLLRWPRDGSAGTPLASSGVPELLLRWGSVGCYTAAGIMLLRTLPRFSVVLLVSGVFQLLQVPFLMLLIRRRDPESLTFATWTLPPTFANCCLVVGLYHQVGAEPNPQVYLWAVAAVLLVSLTWVALAGFGFQYQSGKWFGLCAHVAVLTLPTAIVAPLPLPWRLTLAAQLLWITGALLGLKAEMEQTVPAEESTENSDVPQQPEQYPIAENGAQIVSVMEDDQPASHRPQRLRRDGNSKR